LEKLKDQQVNLSVAFGERKKIAAMFETNITEIARQVKSFKRSNASLWQKIKKLNPRKERYPSKWLELQYGITPLVNEVQGACEELDRLEQTSLNPYYIRVKKTVAEDDFNRGPRPDFMLVNGHDDKPIVANTVYQEGIHTSLVYRMNHDLIQSLAALGITNPFDAAWELLPFSFVLDWAVPVGGYINLLDADFGWTFLTGSTTVFQRETCRGLYFQFPGEYTWVYEGSATDCSYEVFSLYRYVHGSSPWPVFPGLANPLRSSKRVANALSLLVQAFK
jgi:hypothetical protein